MLHQELRRHRRELHRVLDEIKRRSAIGTKQTEKTTPNSPPTTSPQISQLPLPRRLASSGPASRKSLTLSNAHILPGIRGNCTLVISWHYSHPPLFRTASPTFWALSSISLSAWSTARLCRFSRCGRSSLPLSRWSLLAC